MVFKGGGDRDHKERGYLYYIKRRVDGKEERKPQCIFMEDGYLKLETSKLVAQTVS